MQIILGIVLYMVAAAVMAFSTAVVYGLTRPRATIDNIDILVMGLLWPVSIVGIVCYSLTEILYQILKNGLPWVANNAKRFVNIRK